MFSKMNKKEICLHADFVHLTEQNDPEMFSRMDKIGDIKKSETGYMPF